MYNLFILKIDLFIYCLQSTSEMQCKCISFPSKRKESHYMKVKMTKILFQQENNETGLENVINKVATFK
jgi:hypothetical protein